MIALNLTDGFKKIRFFLTILMVVCFLLHLQKEVQKFVEAKKTTSIRLEDSTTLKFPAVTICAEQIYNTDNKGITILCFTIQVSDKNIKLELLHMFHIQVNLVFRGLFICEFTYSHL
jgi:hypothetical protein